MFQGGKSSLEMAGEVPVGKDIHFEDQSQREESKKYVVKNTFVELDDDTPSAYQIAGRSRRAQSAPTSGLGLQWNGEDWDDSEDATPSSHLDTTPVSGLMQDNGGSIGQGMRPRGATDMPISCPLDEELTPHRSSQVVELSNSVSSPADRASDWLSSQQVKDSAQGTLPKSSCPPPTAPPPAPPPAPPGVNLGVGPDPRMMQTSESPVNAAAHMPLPTQLPFNAAQEAAQGELDTHVAELELQAAQLKVAALQAEVAAQHARAQSSGGDMPGAPSGQNWPQMPQQMMPPRGMAPFFMPPGMPPGMQPGMPPGMPPGMSLGMPGFPPYMQPQMFPPWTPQQPGQEPWAAWAEPTQQSTPVQAAAPSQKTWKQQSSNKSEQGGSPKSVNTYTTVMFRNLPNDYTRANFLQLLDESGFIGCYDFVYLPIDFTRKAGLGYAFVNMVTPEDAQRAKKDLQGYSNWSVSSQKVLQVTWSTPLQGLNANIQRYRNSPIMHPEVPEEYKPLLFSGGHPVPFPAPTRPLPRPTK